MEYLPTLHNIGKKNFKKISTYLYVYYCVYNKSVKNLNYRKQWFLIKRNVTINFLV